MTKSELWTVEAVAELKSLFYSEGLNAAEVADRLKLKYGNNYTRSAVLGKIYRMRMKGEVKGKVNPNKPVSRERYPLSAKQLEVRQQRKAALAKQTQAKKIYSKPTEEPIPVMDMPLPKLAPKGEPTLILDTTGCRYPVKTEGFTHWFCNESPRLDSSYCEAHHKICCNRPPPLKRKRW